MSAILFWAFLFPMVSIYFFPILVRTGLKVRTSYFCSAVVTLNLLNTHSLIEKSMVNQFLFSVLGCFLGLKNFCVTAVQYFCFTFLIPLLKLVISLFYTVNIYFDFPPFLCSLLFLKTQLYEAHFKCSIATCGQRLLYWTVLLQKRIQQGAVGDKSPIFVEKVFILFP